MTLSPIADLCPPHSILRFHARYAPDGVVDLFGHALAIKNAGNPMKREAHEVQSGDGPEARYANYFHVGHNTFEVVLEFGQHYEGVKRPRMHTRIIVAPAYAKALLGLFAAAIAEHENLYGEIAAGSEHE